MTLAFSHSTEASSAGRRVPVRRLVHPLIPVLLLALTLRIIDFQGFLSRDDVSYVLDALQLSQGHLVPGTHVWDLRFGVIVPTALAIRLFGLHLTSIALYPLITSQLAIILLYRFGAALYTKRVGLLAAFLLACLPYDIYWSTVTYPDLTGAFFGTLSIFLAYRATNASHTVRHALLALSGIAIAISYLNWEVYLFISLVSLYTYRHTKRVYDSAWILFIAPGITIATETLLYWHATGNPLYRLAVLRSPVTGVNSAMGVQYLLFRWPDALIFPAHPTFDPLLFYYVVLTLFSIIIVWRSGINREDSLVISWMASLFLFTTCAITSVHPLRPLLVVDTRYLYWAVYPSILLIARGISIFSVRGTL